VTGILAIWNDCAADGREHFEHWYAHEHLRERVSLPGFRFGRRYEAVDGSPRFFAFYEVATPAALASPEYRFRLDHPTPATIRAMASFRAMIRTVCEQTHATGALTGAYAVTVRVQGSLPSSVERARWAESLGSGSGIACVRVWVAAREHASPQPTREMSLRGGADASVAGALVVECLRRADADRVAAALRTPGADAAVDAAAGDIGVYAFLCEHRSEAR